MSHDGIETFVRAYHDSDAFARVSRDSREIFVRASHDSRETFVRVSHDVSANFNQFYFSQLSLEMVLFMSHICCIVQIAKSSLRCVCKRLRRVSDGFATGFVTYAMTWRRFCDDFCRTKKYYILKTLANRSRRVRDACEDFAIPCERFATVRDGFANRFANPSRTRRIPGSSEIGS